MCLHHSAHFFPGKIHQSGVYFPGSLDMEMTVLKQHEGARLHRHTGGLSLDACPEKLVQSWPSGNMCESSCEYPAQW